MTAETREFVESSEPTVLAVTLARRCRWEWIVSHVCWGCSSAPAPCRWQALLRRGKQGGKYDDGIPASQSEFRRPVPSYLRAADATVYPGAVLDRQARSRHVVILDPGRNVQAGTSPMAAVFAAAAGTLGHRADRALVPITNARSSDDQRVEWAAPAVGRCVRCQLQVEPDQRPKARRRSPRGKPATADGAGCGAADFVAERASDCNRRVALLAGMQDRLILGAKRGFSKSAPGRMAFAACPSAHGSPQRKP